MGTIADEQGVDDVPEIPAGRAARGSRLFRSGAGVRAGRGLARQAGPDRRPVRSRRLHRRLRATRRHAPGTGAGATGLRREPARQQRQHRQRARREGGARRVHAARDGHQHARGQRLALQGPSVRPGPRFHADRADRGRLFGVDRPGVAERRDGRRVERARALATRCAELRKRGGRNPGPPDVRMDEVAIGRAHQPRALQGRERRAAGRVARGRRGLPGVGRQRAPSRQGREGARDRDHRIHAGGAAARRADDLGNRCPG